jgi:mono/diheme cytochrome c family protein
MTTRGWILVVALGVSACGDNGNKIVPDASVDAPAFDYVARGQYIMNVTAACTFCHTPLLPNGMRDQDKLLSGVDCFVDLNSPTFADNHDGVGCLSTRNLTNHATGLKNATDAQIKNAFLNGVRTDNKNIFPIMPYYIFHNMSDQDADSIVAYLRTVPGVDHTVKPNEQPFSNYNEGLPSGFNYVPFLTDTEIPLPQGGANNASAMRGRYLASAIGLCIDCHTPEVAPFAIQLNTAKAFAGGKVFPKTALGLVDPANTYPFQIVTRNLTPDATGLMGWTKDQIKAAIGQGKDRDGNGVCAATHGGLTSPYAALEPQDLEDIAEYVRNLAPVVNDTAAENCGLPPLPLAVGAPETNCAVTGVALVDDNDSDGTVNDGCPETTGQCANATDDDGDGVPNDGCFVACGNCAGPPVP